MWYGQLRTAESLTHVAPKRVLASQARFQPPRYISSRQRKSRPKGRLPHKRPDLNRGLLSQGHSPLCATACASICNCPTPSQPGQSYGAHHSIGLPVRTTPLQNVGAKSPLQETAILTSDLHSVLDKVQVNNPFPLICISYIIWPSLKKKH